MKVAVLPLGDAPIAPALPPGWTWRPRWRAEPGPQAGEAETGGWVLLWDGRSTLPGPDGFQGPDADVLHAPGSCGAVLPLPLAIRGAALEALGGLHDLPGDLAALDLGLRAFQAGLRLQARPGWTGALPEPPDDAEAVLILFTRHPLVDVLRWALGGPVGRPDPEGGIAAAFRARFGAPLPVYARFSPGDLAGYFAERSSPPLLPAGVLGTCLEAALARGLHAEGTREAPRLDRSHSATWLLANTPYFGAMAARNPLLVFPPPSLREGTPAAPLEILVEGRYEVEVDAGLLLELRDPVLTLPLPGACAEQKDVELFELEGFTLAGGDLPPEIAVPLRAAPGKPARVGFSFRCRVREGVAGEAPEVQAPHGSLPPRHRTRLEGILREIFGGTPLDTAPLERAQRIYSWILGHVAFRWNERMGLVALEARAGNCAQRTRLFILLCRAAGLEARERCGFLAGDLEAQGISQGVGWATTRRVERGHPPFHAWAEVKAGGGRWLPVDFLGTDSGARPITPLNVPDAALRERLRRWTPKLEAYGFGHVDPYRIHLPSVPRTLSGLPTGGPDGGLEALWRVGWGTRHRLRTRLTGLPPRADQEDEG